MRTLRVNTSAPYSIYFKTNLLQSTLLYEYGIPANKRIVIITDSNLAPTLGNTLQQTLTTDGLKVSLFSFPAGEIHKTRETKQQLEDQLLAHHVGRDTCLIALGGGVVSDLVGFLAATYCRGVPVIYIPTTLLAMVDASIGGKTGVNTSHGKNLIGTFTQPHAVFIDTQLLTTLPSTEFRNGVAEMIKHSLIADPALFNLLDTQVDLIHPHHSDFLSDLVYTNCIIKKNIVECDETETGLRHILNFGHTIGHAIEALEQYEISHGDAVAIGMAVESYISTRCGYLSETDFQRIQDVIQRYPFPLMTSAFKHAETFKTQLQLDKKAVQNSARFVLLHRIGEPHFSNAHTTEVNPNILDDALHWAASHFDREHP